MAETKTKPKYVVLRKTTWEVAGIPGPAETRTAYVYAATLEAHHGDDACREQAVADGVDAGEYVAVPAKSFQPVVVHVEKNPRATISAKVSVS